MAFFLEDLLHSRIVAGNLNSSSAVCVHLNDSRPRWAWGKKGPLLPTAAACVSSFGVPRAARLSSGRSWAHSGAVRACPDPLFGGPYMQHRISWADGHMSCILRGGRISARGPGGTGPPPDIWGHEFFAAASIQVYLAGGTGTLLRADPYQSGSVLVRCGN